MTIQSSLITQMNALKVPPESLALWALGQAGFAIKGGETIVYIDPYLSEDVDDASGAVPGTFRRNFPPPLLPEQVTNAQVVFCTHEHDDHTDPQTLGPLALASPGAIFIGPATSRDILRTVGIPDSRILAPQVHLPQSLAGLTFSALPSAHYGVGHDSDRGYRWLGFVIELNGVTLYHAGDTVLYDGLIECLKPYRVDIACLPVNGRDRFREQRGIVGNLDTKEAAELTAAIGADILIPMHNDMFATNHVNPAGLADYLDRHYPRQKYHWLQPGELYFYFRGKVL